MPVYRGGHLGAIVRLITAARGIGDFDVHCGDTGRTVTIT
jgi:hypothetical protein